MEDNLKDYINRAEDMVTDPNFKDSPIKKLEELIENPSKCVSDDQANTFIQNPENRPERVEFERTFIALVAPSLCGKTQSAFAMREMLPLYFALNEGSIKASGRSQPVYANFNSLNRMIKEIAIADLQAIEDIENANSKDTFKIDEINVDQLADNENMLNAVENTHAQSADNTFIETDEKSMATVRKRVYKNILSIYALLSADNLLNSFDDHKFFTLGFLVALMEEAEANYDKDSESLLIPGTKKSWMEFWAKRDDNRSELYFSAISINEAMQKADLFKKYFLFLDEFSGFPWAVLVRNLTRSIGMRVLVANTNSDIANLTGKSHAVSSRGVGVREVWSIVVVKLNEAFISHSDAKYLSLLQNIENIVQSCIDKEKEAVRIFFEDFITNQYFKLRPGVLDFVLEIIKNLS